MKEACRGPHVVGKSAGLAPSTFTFRAESSIKSLVKLRVQHMANFVISSTDVKYNLLTDSTDYLQPEPLLDKPAAFAQRSSPLTSARTLHVCSSARMTTVLDRFRHDFFMMPTECAYKGDNVEVRCCQSSATTTTTLRGLTPDHKCPRLAPPRWIHRKHLIEVR